MLQGYSELGPYCRWTGSEEEWTGTQETSDPISRGLRLNSLMSGRCSDGEGVIGIPRQNIYLGKKFQIKYSSVNTEGLIIGKGQRQIKCLDALNMCISVSVHPVHSQCNKGKFDS